MQNAHGGRNVLPRCKVSRWEFSDEKWVAVLNRTGTAPVAIHGNVRLSRTSCSLHPVFLHFSRKYHHLPTNIFGRTFRPPWRSVFWVYTEKMSCEILKLLQITHKKMNMGLYREKLALRYSFWRNWVSGRQIFSYRPILFSFCFFTCPQKYLQGNLSSIDPWSFSKNSSPQLGGTVYMCFLLFCTYLILVFELSACISWFFAHTKSLFFYFCTCILKCSA